NVHIIDAGRLARDLGLGFRTNTIMQTCFFKLSNVLDFDVVVDYLKQSMNKAYAKKGQKIIDMNVAAIDSATDNLYRFDVPNQVLKDGLKMSDNFKPSVPDFIKNVIGAMINGKGDELPVSAFVGTNGTYPSGTTKYEKRSIAQQVPYWNNETCIQCGKCSLVCPHASIRSKLLTEKQVKNAPAGFQYAKYKTPEFGDGYDYSVVISPRDCTGCGLCVENCPMKNAPVPAIAMEDVNSNMAQKEANFEYAVNLPDVDKSILNMNLTKHNQLVTPLFEFSGSCAGCGQTPYVKLLTQLFGDRMVVANATGCSSIYGGNLPTTPWTKNSDGRGPAWSNSLFEDNAEYGFGMRLALDKNVKKAEELLKSLQVELGESFVNQILNNKQKSDEEIKVQREAIVELNAKLNNIDKAQAKELKELTSHLVKKSVWIMGGDGWAYDIGYGGLDHILYSDKNVNIFVLDTEVYSNTGGQQSKSTPIGASAKFASNGKALPKKDLGLIAMASANVYVARIALGANEAQAVKAIREAEAHNGPSLIIAYAPCVLHGIDMKFQLNQQKEAVKAGHWPLYRFDPKLYVRKGVAPLMLDSPLGDGTEWEKYINAENRYAIVERQDESRYRKLVRGAKRNIRYRNTLYSQISKYKDEE
ncbi:MAG: 4Fe-4S dicluster domain-containing protein, partial [Rickettsiales bacterium]|nr:4Fe-4S dicluster domain-containing protein [Rickettsiales bacterium]